MNRSHRSSTSRLAVWPFELDAALGFSQMTRLKHERAGNLPPRDVWIGPKSGWKVTTMPEVAARIIDQSAVLA